MTYEHLLMKEEKGIGFLTINRPAALNALNTAVLNELRKAAQDIEKDENIRVLIITGAGEKAFVAGADITELAKLNALEGKYFVSNGHQTMAAFQKLPIPVIAAVNGFALGGGLELALACDFIYASENSKFGLPEITLGLIPGFGGTQRLARIIGKNLAKELIFTGKMISAEEAFQLGFVNKVIPPDQLMAEAVKTAGTIAAKGKVSLNAAKQAVNQGLNVDLATACEIEIDAFALCMASEDSKEGTHAFLEKRKPQFKGNLKG
ncbi:MAG: enoyl-CoA hydratase-related protein [Desulfobacterales bacterium]|jgi:enoyl-CoA hydratase|nr:enoyl-CoA hydratase-related protein [Desulfobacterales bacterium]